MRIKGRIQVVLFHVWDWSALAEVWGHSWSDTFDGVVICHMIGWSHQKYLLKQVQYNSSSSSMLQANLSSNCLWTISRAAFMALNIYTCSVILVKFNWEKNPHHLNWRAGAFRQLSDKAALNSLPPSAAIPADVSLLQRFSQAETKTCIENVHILQNGSNLVTHPLILTRQQGVFFMHQMTMHKEGGPAGSRWAPLKLAPP